MKKGILRGDGKCRVGVRNELKRIEHCGLGETIKLVSGRDAVVDTDRVIDSAHGRVVVFVVRFGIWNCRIRPAWYRAGQFILCAWVKLPGTRVVGWATSDHVAPRNHPDHRGNRRIDHARCAKRSGREKVGDVCLPHDLRTSKDDITKQRALVATEEKRAVANDGPAECSSELIAFDLVRCRWSSEIILSVERWIANKFKCVAMKSVRPRFRDHVNDATCVLPVFGTVVRCLDAEF